METGVAIGAVDNGVVVFRVIVETNGTVGFQKFIRVR